MNSLRLQIKGNSIKCWQAQKKKVNTNKSIQTKSRSQCTEISSLKTPNKNNRLDPISQLQRTKQSQLSILVITIHGVMLLTMLGHLNLQGYNRNSALRTYLYAYRHRYPTLISRLMLLISKCKNFWIRNSRTFICRYWPLWIRFLLTVKLISAPILNANRKYWLGNLSPWELLSEINTKKSRSWKKKLTNLNGGRSQESLYQVNLNAKSKKW